MFEQLRRLVSSHIIPNLDSLKTKQENMGVQLTQ